jgi:NAD(P)-dependent dehydrogenase (short-subunit alcohol dehydrogenase family)
VPLALVTGASRGIGAGIALAVASAGFDLVLAARTAREGEGRSGHTHHSGEGPKPVAGSLEATAARVERAGSNAVCVPFDLHDTDAVVRAADQVLERFGRIDVLVNNAVSRGPGAYDPLHGTPVECFGELLVANVVSPIALTQRIVERMAATGGGRVVNLTSLAAVYDPPAALGRGGWGFGYGITKGAFDRVAGLLNAEFGEHGVVAFNAEPGYVRHDDPSMPTDTFVPMQSTPVEAIGAAVAWLATADEAVHYRHLRIHLPALCGLRKLLPGWDCSVGSVPSIVPADDAQRLFDSLRQDHVRP